jgi:hypothetical protein
MGINSPTRISCQFRINKMIAWTILATGIMSLVISVFFFSSPLAIIGLTLTFWGAVLLYITPSRHVSVEIMTTAISSTLANIEKVINDLSLRGKGVYLPPRYLKDFESSLVFVPLKINQRLLTCEEVSEDKLRSNNPEGIFLVPPGLALSKLFEKDLETSFTRRDLNFVREKLPSLLVEDMEIAEKVEIEIHDNMISVELRNHIFDKICQETRRLPKTHEQVGCLLSSAIACVFAKAVGEPVTIEKEELSSDEKTTNIQFRVLEG